jgi:putative transposase
VESDEHLAKCLVYIDLNMIRAGVVSHPPEYPLSGFNEIQNPPERYRVINRSALLDLFSVNNEERFRKEHRHWVKEEIQTDGKKRKGLWSESIAVGSEPFVAKIQQQLGARASKRSIISEDEGSVLKEGQASYKSLFEGAKAPLRLKNSYYWDIHAEYSVT